MSRFLRNRLAQFKIETTYGTDPGAWVGADTIQFTEGSHEEVHENIPRDLIRPYFGGSEHLRVTGMRRITLKVELAGAGTAGTAPKWGPLLRACGMAQALTASVMAVYTPVSTAFESGTLRYWVDGVLHVCLGCRGTVRLMLGAFEIPYLEFTFQGLDTVDPTAVAAPASDFTGWTRPVPANPANGAEVRLGATYTPATGVISGGTALASRGLSEIAVGNALSHIKLLSGESMDVTNREVTGRVSTFLTAADEVTWRAAVKANTSAALGWQSGTAAGNIVGVFGPAVQRTEPQNEDYEGRVMMASGLRFLPSGAAGNDELRIIAR